MISAQWRKVLKDLWSNKIRTILVVLSIGVGVFAVGMVTSSFDFLLNDMQADYLAANPHGASIYCDPFDSALLNSLKRVEGVKEVEGRASTSGKVNLPTGAEYSILMYQVEDLEERKIDRFEPMIPGEEMRLGRREILIERSAIGLLGVKVGDKLAVKLPDGTVRELTVSGFIHDVTQAPAIFSNMALGYVNFDTMAWLGGYQQYTEMVLTVTENPMDEEHVREVATRVAEQVEKSGRTVYFTLVYQPGRHFASDITTALAAMLGVLGAMAVVLSGFLVINTIAALLSQHIRQIGMMKAIGASTSQLRKMYYILVEAFGLMAFLIAAPLSIVVGYLVALGISSFLNFDLQGFRVPASTLALTLLVGLGVPFVSSLLPVRRGTRITVREAISSYGLSNGKFGDNWIDRLIDRIRGLPRPVLISLRNAFRKKARMLLTLTTLSLAGAVFIGVINVRDSFYLEIEKTLGYFLSDVNVNFDRYHRMEEIQPLVDAIPEITAAEGWGYSMAEVLQADGVTSDQITIMAPPAGSKLVQADITSGRWLLPEDENAIVVGNHFIKLRPDVKVGDTLTLTMDGQKSQWKVVGIYNMAGTVIPPMVFANKEPLNRTLNQMGRIFDLRVVTEQHDPLTQQRTAEKIKTLFEANGIKVASVTTGAENMAQQSTVINILIYTLLVMAVLIALVGGLGLMGTMSMNTLERTREIGVMRSIGASDRSVLEMVVVEGMVVGLLSWAIGMILAFPITLFLNYVIGVAFVNVPMRFVLAPDGYFIWMIMVLVISAISSLLPARNATRLTVRDVLAYE